MVAARVAGVPRPVSFIASDSSLSSRLWPAVSMAVKSVPSVNRFGGRVFFFRPSISTTFWSYPLGKSCRQNLLRKFLLGTAFRLALSSFSPNVEDLPSHLRDNGSHGSISIHDFFVANRGHYGRDRLKIIVLPHHEKASADQIVNLAFLFRKVCLPGRNRIGNDGMMIAHLAVIDVSLAQGTRPGSSNQVLRIVLGNRGNNVGSGSGDIGRKMTTVRPWIADQFVPLIKNLSNIERLLCAKETLHKSATHVLYE